MKSLLYISASGRQLWARNKQGWQPLIGEPDGPLWVVTDLAEENFAEINIPRLFGLDRSAFVARQLATRFPDTPYRSVLPPKPGGSLLDRIAPPRQTLLGITSAGRLDAELDAIASIAGIWPVSLLLTQIASNKRLPTDLFVVLPEAEALRIVFIKDRAPVLTRLVPSPNEVAAQAEEIIRTHRYLENSRILQRGARVAIMLFGDSREFAAPLSAARLELIPPPAPWDTQPPADWRFPLFDLALRAPPGQITPFARRTVFLAARLRKAALVTAAASLVIAAGVASSNLLGIVDILRDRKQTRLDGQRLDARFADIERRIAGTGATPELMRRAIALDSQELATAAPFDGQLRRVANLFDAGTHLRASILEWRIIAMTDSPCPKAAIAVEPAAGTPTSSEPPPRRVEMSLDLLMSDSDGPRERAQVLHDVSRRLERIEGVRLLQDPAKERARTALLGGAAKETIKSVSWCMTLPGDVVSPGIRAETAKP